MVNFLTNVSKLDNEWNIIKTSVVWTLWDDTEMGLNRKWMMSKT